MRATKEKTSTQPRLSDRGAFKLKEACAYLGGLAPVTVRRLMQRGLIKRVPAVRHLLFSKVELDRFLNRDLAGSRRRIA